MMVFGSDVTNSGCTLVCGSIFCIHLRLKQQQVSMGDRVSVGIRMQINCGRGIHLLHPKELSRIGNT